MFQRIFYFIFVNATKHSKFLIHQPNRAVYDGLFNGLQSAFAAHNQLTEGEDEVRFQGDGAFFGGVLSMDILSKLRKRQKSSHLTKQMGTRFQVIVCFYVM